MANDVKSLLDSIIDNTKNSYKTSTDYPNENSVGYTYTRTNLNPQTFDKGAFREKLSLYVLHDIICAMMHDETTDLDNMVDQSIMCHIKDNYNGSCYSYLCNARDRLKSPLVTDVIQELDDITDETSENIQATKDVEGALNNIDIKSLLNSVTNYEEFRNKLKEQVSKQVVDDVAGVITKSNDAPTFDNIDDEMNKVDSDEIANNEDTTQESVIFKLCGAIVTESAIQHERISTEEGLNRAIVEYCICEMDYLFKATPKKSIYEKYKI